MPNIHLAPLIACLGAAAAPAAGADLVARSTTAATALGSADGTTIAGSLAGGIAGTARLALGTDAEVVLGQGFAATLVNDPYLVDDDTASIDGASGTVDVLANDADPDGGPLTLVDVEAGDHGSVYIVDGAVRYLPRPGPGFAGSDRLYYTVEDAEGYRARAAVDLTLTGWRRITVVVADDDGSVGATTTLAVEDGYTPPFGEGLIADGVSPAGNASHTFEPIPADTTGVVGFAVPMTAVAFAPRHGR